jgi:2-polyprenyl-6-methoxyphenol hydroxylase-like FAD-dependent oxidoreductase
VEFVLAGCVIYALFLAVGLRARERFSLHVGDSWRTAITRTRRAIALSPAAWFLLGVIGIGIHVVEVGGPPVRHDYFAELILGAEPPPYAEIAETLRSPLQWLMVVSLLAPFLWTALNLERPFLARGATRVEFGAVLVGWLAVAIALGFNLYGVDN